MVNIKDLKWDYSNPHILKFTIKESDIDILGHVNNKVYLNWCELVSWDHSAKLGITPDVYKKYQCACVVIRSENNFSGSLFIGDEIAISTWITKTDKKVRLSRFFQIINIAKNQTVFTSNVDYACVSLINFKPVRMPEIYKNSYEVTCDV